MPPILNLFVFYAHLCEFLQRFPLVMKLLPLPSFLSITQRLGTVFPVLACSYGSARVLATFLLAHTFLNAGHPGGHDNWYLAREFGGRAAGVAVGPQGNVYLAEDNLQRVSVWNREGELVREIKDVAPFLPNDVAVDKAGRIFVTDPGYCLIRAFTPDGTLIWKTGGRGSVDGKFEEPRGIAVGPMGGIYVVDAYNFRIQVFSKGGKFLRKFGSEGSAPGQFKSSPKDIAFLPDGNLLVAGEWSSLHCFKPDGTFVKRSEQTYNNVSVSPAGMLFSYGALHDPSGNLVCTIKGIDPNNSTAFFKNGDLAVAGYSRAQIWKRAYRTKGLAKPNAIPLPAIRSVAQRKGTNLIDLDVEILDTDDKLATFGILAAIDGEFDNPSKWILLRSFAEGTGSKIGNLVLTNQVHRVTWDAGQDWDSLTGNIQFQVLCKDARRSNPVDMHFLTLRLSSRDLTITRSPLQDRDFDQYFRYLLATRNPTIQYRGNVFYRSGTSLPEESKQYKFTNAGAEGIHGPTQGQVDSAYRGSSLSGKVAVHKQGYQEWRVPKAGKYLIEAMGARGGEGAGNKKFVAGYGVYGRGVFRLEKGVTVKVLVGQMGGSTQTGGGGGGGTFVVRGGGIPLLICGGGSGASSYLDGKDGRIQESGGVGPDFHASNKGGEKGEGGAGGWDFGSGAGYIGDGFNSKSFSNGGTGGNHSNPGGFGGGGGSYGYYGGGGGGYSGGAGNYPVGGGGGSYNADKESGVLLEGANAGHGSVYITYLSESGNGNGIRSPEIALFKKSKVTGAGRAFTVEKMGGIREATASELTLAREASTPGTINQWAYTKPVYPRNLPGKVNEAGFDTEHTSERYWWYVKPGGAIGAKQAE